MSSILYEILYIIDAGLEENEQQKLAQEIKSTITDNGGEIIKENPWGKRTLAYPIRMKTEGMYINMDFNGPAELPALINEYVSTHTGILRHFTLKVSKARLLQEKLDEAKKKKELQEMRERQEAQAQAQAQAQEQQSKQNLPKQNLPKQNLLYQPLLKKPLQPAKTPLLTTLVRMHLQLQWKKRFLLLTAMPQLQQRKPQKLKTNPLLKLKTRRRRMKLRCPEE